MKYLIIIYVIAAMIFCFYIMAKPRPVKYYGDVKPIDTTKCIETHMPRYGNE